MSLTSTVAPTRAHGIRRRSWKTPVVLGIATLAAVVLLIARAPAGESSFNLSLRDDAIQLPVITVGTLGTGVVATVLLALATAAAAVLTARDRRVPLWIPGLATAVAVIGFLSWAANGATLQVPGLLTGTLILASPLVFGALGGVLSERVGVVNIAIEGQLLGGAFVSAVVATITGSPIAGLVGAAVAGTLVSFILSTFAIRYVVDQVIVGVVINVLISGITGFLYSQWLVPNAAAVNSPPRFPRIEIPLLSEIPVLGPALFRQPFIVYLMYAVVILVFVALYKTRWGLRLRAVGEHPQAADTVGINVNRTRFWNVALAGAIAGLGGAFITLGAVGAFGRDMTNGAGFIALAAVIFGRWDPIRATLAALLFGFTQNLQNALSVIGSPVPSQFMLMLPYVVTIVAVAGLVGHSRGPAASGKPYVTS